MMTRDRIQEYQDIVLRQKDGIAWITINRPEKANALRHRTFDELRSAFVQFNEDDAVRAIVLTGAGDRVFSAGIDLTPDDKPTTSRGWDDHTLLNADTCNAIWNLDKPVISAVNGHAAASGCLLALICDITVASTTARFSEPEIRHGNLSPMLLLPWMTHMKPLHLFYYTGDALEAEEAKQLGLVNKVVEPSQLLDEAERIARRIANAPANSITLAKRALRTTYDIMGFRGAQSAHRYIDNYLLDNHGDLQKDELIRILREEGMRAFLSRRDGPYGSRK